MLQKFKVPLPISLGNRLEHEKSVKNSTLHTKFLGLSKVIKMVSKEINVELLIIICIILLISPSCLNAKFDGEKIVIGTGSMTGLYYPIGGSLCRFLSKDYNKTDKLICSIASTTGGFYNLNSMRSGNMDIGIAQSDWEYNAYNGTGTFKKIGPMKNLRLIATMHKEYFSILARKDSGIRSINDLKGKRINIGAPGTGIRGAMLDLMEARGWTRSDFSILSELKSAEQAQALCDNKIDVMSDFIGHPNAAMQEATVSCEAVLIPVDDITISQMIKIHPYYESGVIPGNIYPENPNDIKTLSVHSSILTTDELDEKIAYKLTKSIVKHFTEIKSLSGALSNIKKENLPNVTSAPLHQGARRYYEEIGLIKIED